MSTFTASAQEADGQEVISTFRAQRLLLEFVNAERGPRGLGRLQVSRKASKLARDHALEMARYGYIGHYDLSGRKPELRYNLRGETDHVAENIAFLELGGRALLTEELVRSMFADLMASPSHRANILHPAHTHMGYAVTVRRSDLENWTRIYAVQEFVNDWGNYDIVPGVVAPGDRVTLRGKLKVGARLAYVALATEPLPGARAPEDVGEADLHYRQPIPEQYFESGKEIRVASDGSFEVDITIPARNGPLDVYLTAWVIAPGLQKPFRAMTQVLLLEKPGS